MQAIKLRVGHSIRRDSIPLDQFSYASLLLAFQELFGRPLQNETLRYRDDVLEWIDISSDRELREALRLNMYKTLELKTVTCPAMFPNALPSRPECGRHGRWRKQLHEEPREEPHEEPNLSGTSSPKNIDRFEFNRPPFRRSFRHPAICDSCNGQIVGVRHKCNDCLDFDLCSLCIEKSAHIHPGHTFTNLHRSFPRWHHRHPERDHGVAQPAAVAEPRLEPPNERTSSSGKNENESPTLSGQPTAQNIEEKEERNENKEQLLPQHIPAAEPAAAPQGLQGSIIVEALNTLSAMGFEDKQKNVRLFLACGGDLEKVMDKLLEE